MSCEKLNTILLGGRRSRDGKYPVQREILFSPVGRIVADALPDACELVYVRQESETELEGIPSIVCPDDADFTEMLRAAVEKLDGDVMVLSTPMPDAEQEEYERVIRMHRQSKNAVSMLTCGAHGGYMALRGVPDARAQENFGQPSDVSDGVHPHCREHQCKDGVLPHGGACRCVHGV